MPVKNAELIGKCALMQFKGGLYVDMKILDVRERFGRDDVLVTPCEGKGETWVELRRLIMEDTK